MHTTLISAIKRVQLQLQEVCPRSGAVGQSVDKQDIIESLSEASKGRRTN